jgi:osmoprotectant transport system permease protein
VTGLALLGAALLLAGSPAAPRLRVGSKKFTEGVILGEIARQVGEAAGARAVHRRELGGTRILWDALLAGEIDLYPEYTGTLAQEILRLPGADDETLRRGLAQLGVRMGRPLGFEDTYAIGMREETAARLGIRRLSDLAGHPDLRLGLSHEFMDRKDGWPALRDGYGLGALSVRGVDHDIAYRGLADGAIDAADLYSTDAEIAYYRLRVLEDDRRVFPDYRSVLVWRVDLDERAPQVVRALAALEGRIAAADMVAMNASAKLDRIPEAEVAAAFLRRTLGLETGARTDSRAARILARTREHLVLVALSLAAAIAVGVPLGILAERRRRLGQALLAAAGVVQTVPSLALLVLLIPFLGIGERPALAALFLYSLLPILRGTQTGLASIPPELRESAAALGLPPGARLRLVELPMAARSILSGVKTSAVINVGTATLGALIGAGGYGQPILAGIRLDDLGLILEGAVPAALLALAVQGLFDLAERALVPRGLRLAPGT